MFMTQVLKYIINHECNKQMIVRLLLIQTLAAADIILIFQMVLGQLGDKFGARQTFGIGLLLSGLSMVIKRYLFIQCSDQLVVCSFACVCVYRNLTLQLDQDNSQVFVFLLFYSKTNFEMIAGFEQSYLPFLEFIIL